METKSNKQMFFCDKCKKKSETVRVANSMKSYYTFNINKDFWKEEYGNDELVSQEFFCIHCEYPLLGEHLKLSLFGSL
jgi:hypothetical protein